VLIKEFRWTARLIETRLLVRHTDGGWAGYTYVWNSAQTEAFLTDSSRTVDLGDGGPGWKIPSRAECLSCHTAGKGGSLGLETAQMNRAVVYPESRRANQLATLAHIGLLPSSLADPSAAPAFPSISDNGAPIAVRARAYLHANCSQCHPGPGAKPNFLFATPFSETLLCNETPSTAISGTTHLIAPGDPTASQLPRRMRDLGRYRMPLLGSSRVHEEGLSLIEAWIRSIDTCR
jgi:hypothetical protein